MISTLTFSELIAKYQSGELSPVQVVKHYLDNINKYQQLNNFVITCEETALKQASEAEQRYKTNTARPLEGMPVSVKDLFCTQGIRTTACSKILENFVPDYESFITQKTFEAGGIMIGKTNMDEFAMGAANKYSAFGPAINPWTDSTKQQYVTGGSSGGAAGSTAAYQCLFALGSDTGGSVRQPAAFCGIVGIRPTYGRCSRRGMIAFSSSLDQAGVFGRDVHTAAALLENIMGYDECDSTSRNIEVPKLTDIKPSVKNLKVGLLHADTVQNPEIKETLKQTAKWLEEEGAIVEHVEIKHFEDAIPIYYVITPCEAASNLARYDGIRYGVRSEGENYYEQCMKSRELFGDEVKRRILIGTHLSSSAMYDKYFNQAMHVRQLLKHEVEQCFEKYDILLSPTTPHTAFPINQTVDPVDMYHEDLFTAPVNLAGCCGISIPVTLSKNNQMPIGMQIIAPAFREDLLIHAGSIVENKANFQSLPIEKIYHS